ncbi:dienelactone hydrolase family protein [Alicyclobacillus macrosporangiidus]|uniref:Carboxymethylenebutenolidase n=1 Tax=Alicyclobacillus macrosporangiidus TaxID=392015 RepID=A0A1I7IHN0_9BACL|nr:dienelactone hydrolase family protein [Alicyclobacillus macrosporangiidus]SFU72431.1 carboxymethylenebutenolidase [Alicyclobacillus macrosporangiidus]
MSLITQWVRYGDQNEYSGYLAKPRRAGGPLPAVMVIQEIWGVDAHIQDVVERFAKAGYTAFAPDLYSRNGERPAVLASDRIEAVKSFLDSLPPSAWHDAQAREAALARLPGEEGKRIQETFTTLFGGLQVDKYMPQLLETAAYLRTGCEHSQGQPVMSIGFCLGGALSARLACQDEALKGAVIFYGHAPDPALVSGVRCPVRGFYGGLDHRITDQVPGLAEAMRAAGKDFQYTVYEGAQHAFFNDTRSAYHPEASRDAFAQVLGFFNGIAKAGA